MIYLPDVTLIAITSVNLKGAVSALKYSTKKIKFAEVKLVSHRKPWFFPNDFVFEKTDKIDGIDKFSYKMIYELPSYIHTNYAMIIHSDGFVVNPEQWRNEFLEYDYIGAPWPISDDGITYRDINSEPVRVGNGVSLRSKKIMEMPTKLNLPWEPYHGYYNEDGFLCCKNKHILEEHGVKFAPIDVAKYFSHELMIDEIEGITPFAFHKHYGTNKQYPKY